MANVDVTALRYTGPIRLPTPNGADTSTIVVLGNISDAGTDGIGEAVFTISNQDVTAAAEWALYASLYQEARVLGMEFIYEPRFHDGFTATDSIPPQGVIATSHTAQFDSTTPASPASLYEYGSARPFTLSRRMKMIWKMDGPDEAHFTPVTSIPSLGGFLAHTGSGTAGRSFGTYYTKWMVQFKGRK